jgi:L-seryl-tRNA(Ser) seleniumtransferase
MTGIAGIADLVCFSAKYMGGPNSVGFVCGRKPWVESAAMHGFLAYGDDNRSLGRGYKLDRQEIVATLVTLQEWFVMDHRERFRIQEQRIKVLTEGLSGLQNVRMTVSKTQPQLAVVPRVTPQAQNTPEPAPWIRLQVTLDETALGKTAAEVAQALQAGDPSILAVQEDNSLVFSVHTLREGEDQLVADRLRSALQS